MKDWMKVALGLGAALTGFGAAGVGPLAGMLGGAGAGSAAAGAGSKAGFGTLLKGAAANSLASTGTSMALGAMMPQYGMSNNLMTPGQMEPLPDSTAQLRELMEKRKLRLGGIS